MITKHVIWVHEDTYVPRHPVGLRLTLSRYQTHLAMNRVTDTPDSEKRTTMYKYLHEFTKNFFGDLYKREFAVKVTKVIYRETGVRMWGFSFKRGLVILDINMTSDLYFGGIRWST